MVLISKNYDGDGVVHRQERATKKAGPIATLWAERESFEGAKSGRKARPTQKN